MRNVGTLFVALVAAAAAVGTPAPAPAQTADAASWLRGRVVEGAGGAPVADARIRVAGPSLERVATSAADGTWTVGPLAPGTYRVAVEHLGFAPAERVVELATTERADAAASGADRASPSAAGRVDFEIALTPRPVALDALVVTAGRRVQRLADAPVATELVSRREIRETGASDLASVLTERTGVELEGGHPAGAGVMIQGLGSERVLVLLDGRPFIGRISGKVDVSRIPTSMIERIEVVKGPQSTLYGSDAMGGVVNVITRAPALGSAWSTGASVTAGGDGRRDVSVHGLAGAGEIDALIDLGRRSIELAPGLPGVPGALAERWDGLAKLGWRTPVEGLRVEASGLLLDERQRWRSGQLYTFADNRQWSAGLGATYESGAHRLSSMVHATAFDHLSRRASADEPVAGTGEREVQRLAEAEVLYGLDLGSHALDAGVELQREAIRSDRVVGGSRTDHTVEAFSQATLVLGGVSVVPGVRASRSERWGTHLTPRVAALFRPVPEVGLRVSVGEGFRAPSFKELAMSFLNVGPGFGYTVRGNPDLDAEVSRNVSASAEWAGERLYLRVQGFDNRFEDFIETRVVGDSSGITVHTYGNIDDGFTRGLEAEAAVTFGGWRVEGGYALLRAERAGTGEPLLGRPRQSARSTVGWVGPGGLRASATGVYTGRTPMARSELGTEWREGFLRFDARLAQDLPGGFELIAGIDNVLDERVEDWPGFTGRHLYTTISWRAVGGSGANR